MPAKKPAAPPPPVLYRDSLGRLYEYRAASLYGEGLYHHNAPADASPVQDAETFNQSQKRLIFQKV